MDDEQTVQNEVEKHEVWSSSRLRSGSHSQQATVQPPIQPQVSTEQPSTQATTNMLPPNANQPSGSVTTASDSGMQNALTALIEQNRLLLSRILRNEDNNNDNIRVQSTCSPSTSNNGYYVMPDFNNSINIFSGRESNTDARAWLKSVEGVAKLHNWPDSFKLEIVRTKLDGPSKNWYVGRTFSSWGSFVDQFNNTFVGNELCTVDRVRNMSNRVQTKGECIIEYFHHKARLCREISLPFNETKQQIVEGVYSHDLCNYLIARTHLSEDELLADINSYNNLKNARINRIRSTEPTKTTTSNAGNRKVSSDNRDRDRNTVQRSTIDTRMKPSRDTSNVTCYSCGKIGHLASSCPTRTCHNCHSSGHSARNCPGRQGERQDNNGGEHVSVLERSPTHIVPPYMLDISIKFPNSESIDVQALVDTGSPVSLIKSTVVPYVSGVVPPKSDLVGINGSKLNIVDQFDANIVHNDLDAPISLCFHVVPDNAMRNDCLLGRNFLSHPRVNLNVSDGRFEVGFKKFDNIISFAEILSVNYTDYNRDDADINLNVEDTLPDDIKQKIKKIYVESYVNHESVVNTTDDYRPEIHIILKNDKQFYFRPRRLSFFEKGCLQKMLDDMLTKGIIRRSSSEYSSPIVLVKKKNGDFRMCVDYRELNKYVVKDRYPLPLIDDNLYLLRGKKYFTCLDLKDGFHHIYVADESIKFTSFTTPLGQFEFLKMPFGLANGPSCFSRFIQNVFDEFIRKNEMIVYFDDIMLATETIEEHLELLSRVLKVMKNKQLEIRLDKTQFLKREVIYLGYCVNQYGIQPNPKNVSIIENYPVPQNNKELQSFIGLSSYFRRFIPNFAIIAKPLYSLLKKNIPYEFGEEQMRSFDSIKLKLGDQPLLAIYSPNAMTELHCDASSHGYGSILFQKQPDNQFHPIFYYSHRTTESESRYHSYELEMLAIINSIKRFRVYLQGIKFKIITDCNSVALTLQKKDINPRIARWAMFLQNFVYEIEHRPGSQMQHVDALSRCNHILVIEGCTFNQALAIKQQTDPEISSISRELEQSEHPQFELRNGLVYRKNNDRLLFYVPTSMRNQVIRSCHDDMCHVGTNKTIELIKQIYWFPKLSDHVRTYISNCLKCIIFSPKNGKDEGLLNLIDKGDKPFQTIHVDHYGPLNQTFGRFRHILVVVDAFSKFLNLYPVRTVAAKESCLRLTQYFLHYSKPIKIISDRGSCFRSDVFKEFCERYDIKHIKTAVGMPSANGQVERYNRGLTVMLSKLMHEHSKNWNEYLYQIQFAVNNTFNRSIHCF